MATVIYDADCRICSTAKRVCKRLDWFRLLAWKPFENSGLTPDQIYLVQGGRRWGGFSAIKRIAARLPLLYLLALAGVMLSPWTLAAWALVELWRAAALKARAQSGAGAPEASEGRASPGP